jgi:glyoxalase family protein
MKLEGVHHVTSITGDAARNVDFYVRVLGLRLVKKTVNQDDPTVYHLFYGDDEGSPGHDMTFFEYPGAARGRAGDGMVHTVAFRVAGDEALAFWTARLAAEGIGVEAAAAAVTFLDPEGLRLELRVEDVPDAPLVASAPDVPPEHALLGFAGVRAYTNDPSRSASLLEEALGFESTAPGSWEARGEQRGGFIAYDAPPSERGRPGAGTVHHVAWASSMEEHEAWRDRVARTGARPTPVIDRFYFRSVYFREPSGVLFELATMGPGFSVDEPAEHLGERLALPPFLEPQRERIERALTPLPDMTGARSSATSAG